MATRMRPFTERTPKWLLPVAGRPFAFWQLEWLARTGVDDVVCCIGHLGEPIREVVGDGASMGLRLTYSEDGVELRGTGGALALAADRGLLRDEFMIVYGDSYLPIDVDEVWQAFVADERPALMTVFRNEGAYDTSNAAYADGRVVRYTKTSSPDPDAAPLDHIDYGLSAISRHLLDDLPRDTAVDLATLFEALASEDRLAGFEVRERFYEIGSPLGLAELERFLAGRQAPP